MTVTDVQKIYKTNMAVWQGVMFASQTWEAPELIENALHFWTSEGGYRTSTYEDA